MYSPTELLDRLDPDEFAAYRLDPRLLLADAQGFEAEVALNERWTCDAASPSGSSESVGAAPSRRTDVNSGNADRNLP